MSALAAFLFVGGIVTLGIFIQIGFDFLRQGRRLKRMAAEAERLSTATAAGTEKENIADRTPHVRVESRDASTDKHTGAGASDGGRKPGPGVTGEDCARCHGCGQLANDEDETPWKFWAELPPGSDLAVRVGLVRPHQCPACGGSGKKGGAA